MSKIARAFCSVALICAILLPCVSALSIRSYAAEENEPKRIWEGVSYSILGDSISTYDEVTDGVAADTTNSTIRKNAVHYTPGKWDGVYLEDTWWVQLEELTGLRRLVNNSWSGSTVFVERVGTKGGYVDRCVQLHDDTGENAGEEPDIIFVFLGTNDFSYCQDLLFSDGEINYDELIVKNGDTYTYREPTTVVEAYAIMMHKITVRYPNAELYCMSMMARRDTNRDKVGQPIEFNAELKAIADRYGAIYIDLYNIGIPSTDVLFDVYFPDQRVHPGVLGMDVVTSATLTAMLQNSRYVPEGTVTHEVTWEKSDVLITSTPTSTLAHGDSYSSQLIVKEMYKPMVRVTMGGVDITNECYSDGKIYIPSVTGDVKIEAEAHLDLRTPLSFRWEFNGSQLVSKSEGYNAQNTITKLDGTVENGVNKTVRYGLDEKIILLHDLPWAVEWKSKGTFKNSTANGGLLLAPGEDNVEGMPYIYKCEKSIIAIGVRMNNTYNNYGIMLSKYGIDAAAEHVYRLENRIAEDGSNMVYLFVDGIEIGPMINCFSGTTDLEQTSNYLSGQDIILGYMGTKNHPLTNCSIEYIQIHENGFHLNHSYTDAVTPPTCTEKGYTTRTCICGDTIIIDYVDATGHTYTDVVTPPTCKDKGYTTHTCQCGHVEVDSYVDATGHNYKDQVIEPSCTEGGFAVKTCECGESDITSYVDAKGHIYDREVVSDDYLKSEATYSSAAIYYKSCACGEKSEETFSFGAPLVNVTLIAVVSAISASFLTVTIMLLVIWKKKNK